jgi:hypothetical protein
MDRRFNSTSRLVGAIFFLAIVSTAAAEVIYVDADANGVNDGSSWVDAYNYLQDALADANTSAKPVEIHVAKGIYTPDSNSADPNGSGDRTATFRLINGVSLRGGYAGFGEPNSNARDIEVYETILSGDLDGDDVDVNDPYDLLSEPTRADNSYHVVTGNGTDGTAALDGFIVTGGSKREWPDYYSAGIYIDYGRARLLNCTITGNVASQGGGLYIGSGGVKLINCIISRNAANYAGGMLNGAADTTLIDCIFVENIGVYSGGASIPTDATFSGCNFVRNKSGGYGGAIKNDCSAPRFDRCVFIENTAGGQGGAVYNYEGDLTIAYCTFRGNSADSGGGIYQGDTDSSLTGCRFIENTASNGGAILNVGYSDPILTNCAFVGNSAETGGGFYTTRGCAPKLVNCTFLGNSAYNQGGGMCITNNYDFRPILHNCIFRDNSDSTGTGQSGQINYEDGSPIVNYCCIQGWTGALGGSGNIDVDPCFAEPGYWDPNGTPSDVNDDFWVDGDYRLKSQAGRWEPNSQSWVQDEVSSPCIDAGDWMSPIGLEPFPNGGRVNMGAYGGTAEASKSYFGRPVCETIVAGDINGDCRVNFLDFRLMALHWLQDKNPPPPG